MNISIFHPFSFAALVFCPSSFAQGIFFFAMWNLIREIRNEGAMEEGSLRKRSEKREEKEKEREERRGEQEERRVP